MLWPFHVVCAGIEVGDVDEIRSVVRGDRKVRWVGVRNLLMCLDASLG